MSITPMDLDSSLDDLIKKRRQNKPQPKKQQFQKNDKNHGKNNSNNQSVKSRLSTVQSNKGGKVTKSNQSQHQRGGGGINARLSTAAAAAAATHAGPLFTAKNQPQQQQNRKNTTLADPSQIIITKAFAPPAGSVQSRIGNNNSSNSNSRSSNNSRLNTNNISSRLSTESSILQGRLGNQPTTNNNNRVQRVETTSFTRSASTAASSESLPDFSIRGRSSTVKPSTGMSITGESGPTLLLISGLDKQANSEDLETSLEVFGHILSCEVLRKRDGSSYGEAEVEFSTRKAAMDCIARLDNQMADGRILRVLLRDKNRYNAPKPVQSVISSSPSYTPSGKMYVDQMTPRYDIKRQ